ncbi:MAG: YitT family protein, partial [Coprobacillus sp.]|nr:YitT family protein [Coprobacillus sp.]
MKKIIQIIIGNVLMAFAFSTLILDNSIVAGGVSGISTVFHFYTGISVSLCVGIINIALFIIGFCFLGKAFAMKTLISTFLFPILLEFFNQQPYLHGLLNDQLLICILGGFLLGLGIGLVLKAGGSTGGFDILALVVEKYFKVPVTLLVNGIDATILVLQISFHSVPEIVYGIMTILITAYMMNYLLSSGKGCVQVLVMSKEIERMKTMILNDMDAGVTLLDGKSGFYGNDTEVVLTILPYRKLPDL